MPRYLQKRRRRWYAVLEIPSKQRKVFSKSRFIQSLQTDSLSIAEVRLRPLIHKWKQLINEAKSPNGDILSKVGMVRADIRNSITQDVPEWEIEMAHEEIATLSDDDSLFLATQVAHGKSILLKEHIEEFIASLDNTPKTNDVMRTNLFRFAKTFPIPEDCTRASITNWVNKELMQNLNLSPVTIRRVISNCKNYWDFLERTKGLTKEPPFHKILPPIPKRKNKASVTKKRKAFRSNDYQKLLSACPTNDETLHDLIMIAAHTGCRIEEICSLKLDQVSKDRIEVKDAKSEAGWRTVPIHSDIKDVIARHLNNRPDGYLLTGLSLNKYGDRCNAVGKRFGRLKTRLGYGKDYVFHSFRRGFATKLENAMIPRTVVARLMGHELGDQTFGGYSDGLNFEQQKDAIEQISWQL